MKHISALGQIRTFCVLGTSMFPALRSGEVIIARVGGRLMIQPYDLIVFRAPNDVLRVHRVWMVVRLLGVTYLLEGGDGERVFSLIRKRDVCGKALAVLRDGCFEPVREPDCPSWCYGARRAVLRSLLCGCVALLEFVGLLQRNGQHHSRETETGKLVRVTSFLRLVVPSILVAVFSSGQGGLQATYQHAVQRYRSYSLSRSRKGGANTS